MFEMMVLVILLGLAFTWTLFERSNWLPGLAERLVRTLARQYPRRPEVREQEWLGILDLKTTGWSKLGYALGCVWTTLRGQENVALTSGLAPG